MTSTAPRTMLVGPLRDGHLTIPAELLASLGIDEKTILRLTLADGELRIAPVRDDEPSQGSPGLRALYEYFAPVREEILRRGISSEEVNADIDAAIAEVRAERRAKGG